MKKLTRDNTIVIYVIMVAIFLGIIIAAFLSFYFSHKNSDTIQPGVYIKGTNVSGLSKEDAKKLVSEALQGKMNDNVVLNYKNYDFYVEIEQIEAEFDIDASVDFAYQIGRSSNFLQNVKDYISVLFVGIDIDPVLKYNEKDLSDYIDTIQSQLPDQLVQSSYYLEDDDELVITNGKVGAGIYKEDLIEMILKAIQDISYNNQYIEIPTYMQYPDPIDLNAIHNDIYKAPQDAYFTTDPYMVYPHVVGESVGLPSIWVLAAVTIGGNLMGIVGMLVFIPLLSVLYTIFREFVYLRLKKQNIKQVTKTEIEEYTEEILYKTK